MERYDVSAPIAFKKGYYRFCPQDNFNFQLNRVIMWDGGRKEDIDKIGAGVVSSEAWVSGMKRLADEAHAEGRTENEIAYRRMTEFFMYDSDPDKKTTYEEAAALFYEYYGDYFDKGIVTRTEVPYGGGYLPVMSAKAKSGTPIDTILLHGGNDSYFEEFFFAMLYFAERGFDVYLYLLKNVRSLTLSLMTDRQDAGAHCNVGNTKLALDTMADWIEQRKREEKI